MIKLGSHVSLKGDDMFLGSIREAISYGANTLMVYTGAPQNTARKEMSVFKIEEAKKLADENNISDIVVHAPYIINLANTIKKDTSNFGTEFLKKEIKRTIELGSKILVLHPGASVGADVETALKLISENLDKALKDINDEIYVCLETMAGKGTECGRTFEEIKTIMDNCNDHTKSHLGVCFDTCHIWDAGYDIKDNFNNVIKDFDNIIGIDKIKVVHLNDSKNIRGAGKDRHTNIGYGEIGFDSLCEIAFFDKFKDIPIILETPYVDEGRSNPPYKEEIEMIKNKKFIDNFKGRLN